MDFPWRPEADKKCGGGWGGGAEAPPTKKPYNSCLWDSGRWEWWEIILGWIPLEFHGIWAFENAKT